MGKEQQDLDTALYELHVEVDSLEGQKAQDSAEGEPLNFVAAHDQEWQNDLVQVGG